MERINENGPVAAIQMQKELGANYHYETFRELAACCHAFSAIYHFGTVRAYFSSLMKFDKIICLVPIIQCVKRMRLLVYNKCGKKSKGFDIFFRLKTLACISCMKTIIILLDFEYIFKSTICGNGLCSKIKRNLRR